jgi:hypothetical protein
MNDLKQRMHHATAQRFIDTREANTLTFAHLSDIAPVRFDSPVRGDAR